MVDLAVLLLVVSILLVDGFLAFITYRLIKPPRYVEDWTPADLGLSYEDVEFQTEDGLKIRGWWIDVNSDRTLIVMHGYTASRWAFYVKRMIKEAASREFNVLTFDFRAHGESEGKITTFGFYEILDLRAALDWLQPRSQKVCLLGYSMGGIVAVRGLAEDDRPLAGVADSAPVYADKSAARGLKYFARLPTWIYPVIKGYAMFLGAKNVDLMDYADKVKKPLLLVVGEQDPLVKVDEVKEFYERNKRVNDVQIWVGRGGHVRIMLEEPGYADKVLSFLGGKC